MHGKPPAAEETFLDLSHDAPLRSVSHVARPLQGSESRLEKFLDACKTAKKVTQLKPSAIVEAV